MASSLSSLLQAGARSFVNKFFAGLICTGSLTLVEDEGAKVTFEGSDNKFPLNSVMRVHSPQFYVKVMTQADLGLADSYISGDISFVNGDEGLLNFFMILIANMELKATTNQRRSLWTPLAFTCGIASAIFRLKHSLRRNSITQAQRNISRHYDLSENEDLKEAQMRKIGLLIEKAKIEKGHQVLEIGSGWGIFAIEVVKRTGCKYTGITLSEKQLKYSQMKALEAGLQDQIQFFLLDYRNLPASRKYDRIISCEMIEHVGDQFTEEYFASCERVLAEDGRFVLQFISVPDDRYDEYRKSPGFMKEYIFPGMCIPSLSRITSAMASSSRLCVEHVESIGSQYYQTLRYWRKNFSRNHSDVLAMGFDDKFIRTWEYYFDYCAAGYKMQAIGDYQIVFARPRNVPALADPRLRPPPTEN